MRSAEQVKSWCSLRSFVMSALIRGVIDGDAARLTVIANEVFRDNIRRGMSVFDEEYFMKLGGKLKVRVLVAEVDGVAAGSTLMTNATVETPA